MTKGKLLDILNVAMAELGDLSDQLNDGLITEDKCTSKAIELFIASLAAVDP